MPIASRIACTIIRTISRTTAECIAPLVAGLFYGGWAAYSNAEYSRDSIVIAFIIQGSFAFVSTWFLTRLVRWLIHRQQPGPQYFVIFIQCASVLALVPGGLHLAAGTPNIVQAMLPGLIIGNSYVGVLIYRYKLKVCEVVL